MLDVFQPMNADHGLRETWPISPLGTHLLQIYLTTSKRFSNHFSQYGRLEVDRPIEVEWPVQGMCQCQLPQSQVEAPQLRGPCMHELVPAVRPYEPDHSQR